MVKPQRPDAAPPNPTCNDWFRLQAEDRVAYAEWQLFTLRTNDGIPHYRLPTSAQVQGFRDEMDSECHLDDLHVASLAAISHDVYTAAYDSRRYLER
jgi:hypothetical protein